MTQVRLFVVGMQFRGPDFRQEGTDESGRSAPFETGAKAPNLINIARRTSEGAPLLHPALPVVRSRGQALETQDIELSESTG